MSLEELISTYGYAAVLVGSMLEGETVLVIAGFLSYLGHLRFPLVVAVAFAGTFAADQFLFHLGRRQGGALLDRWPDGKAKAARVLRLLNKHQVAVILGFRFVYGFRVITPFLIGMSRVPPVRFFLLNGTSALAWALLISTLGYFLGRAIEAILGDLKRYEIRIVVVLALIGFAVWLVHRFRKG